jgi:hypothetical protein
MKYINFKRFKFSTIFKNINFKRYERILTHVAEFVIFIIEYVFSGIYKNFNFIRRYFLKTYNNIDFKKYNFSRIFKFEALRRLDFKKIYKYLNFRRFYFDIRRFDFRKLTKYLNPKTYNINLIKNIDLISSKFVFIHLPASIIFFGLLYLVIPTFYNYDKSNIENIVCKRQNIECLIRGEVKYSFYPTPRIKIKDVIIKDFFEKKNTLVKVEHTVIKLSIKNLLTKEKHKFKKIELDNFEINFDLKNFKKYKNIFEKKINLIPAVFTNGRIVFLDGKDYVATINDTNLNLILEEYSKEAVLKGKFLDDNIYISLNSKKVDNKLFTDIILKMSDLNLLTKANFFNSEKDKNIINGNILIKKDKHRFTGVFNYKDNEITINKSNLKNIFLDGKLEGKIKFFPFFDFDLDLSLNNINFTKLYNYFLAKNEKKQKNLFTINKKINGKLSLSSDKIYSSYNLVKSFESRIKFNNGDILVEQFLINLGKLGAADILGTINNGEKFTNFKYESNIFVDNQKKFLSKFGIYNKQNIASDLFVSGNFDLKNTRISFYEISSEEKLSNNDVNFIEKEFNDFMLTDGYESLFRFPKFKEFVKSITSEIN